MSAPSWSQLERRAWLLPSVAALLAVAVRALPGRFPADYDEGVYVSAAMAFVRGGWPYRDFVFLHPPGVLLWLAPWAWLQPDALFLFARGASIAAGGASVWWLARAVGGVPGFVAGLVWAFWWEALCADRGVFLEPLMISAGMTALALAMLRDTPRAWLGVGALLALSCCFKLWGALWCLPVLAATPRRALARVAVGFVVALLVVLTPFLVMGGGDVFEQLVRVHALRAPDGDLLRSVRLHEMFVSHSLGGTVAVALAVPFVFFSKHRRVGLAALASAALAVTAFLAAAAYWNQYNSALVCFLAVVLAVGLDGVAQRLPKWVAVTPVLLVALWWRRDFGAPPSRVDELKVAAALQQVPGEVCAFENFELLVANRRPSSVLLIDSYGQQLRDAAADGARFASTAEAFASEASQRTLRTQLQRCAWLRTGWRGEWQMNGATKAQVARDFEPIGEGLYRRRASAERGDEQL